jgi:hypothetical protein
MCPLLDALSFLWVNCLKYFFIALPEQREIYREKPVIKHVRPQASVFTD